MTLSRPWRFVFGLLVVIMATTLTTRFWTAQIARSLTCAESLAPSDAMLVEHFDPNYLIFEPAAALEQDSLAPLTLIPVETSHEVNVANTLTIRIPHVMTRHQPPRRWR